MDEKVALAKRIGGAVRRLRRLRGWSQEGLAERTELSTQFVGLVERGQELPSLTTLLGLGDAFDVTIQELIAGPRRTAAPWEREALELLRGVPEGYRRGVVAMLRALVDAPLGASAPRARERR